MKNSFALMFVATAIAVIQMNAATEIEIDEKMTEWATECGKETDISEGDLERLKEMDFGEIDEEKLNNWSACWLGKSGMMDAAGHINKDAMMKAVEEMAEKKGDLEEVESLKESMESCCKKATDEATDPAKAAGDFMKCVMGIKQ